MLLLAISVVLFIYLAKSDFIEARETHNLKALLYQRKAVGLIIGVLLLSFALYQLYPHYQSEVSFFKLNWLKTTFTVSFALAISYFWFLFFRALDIFEKEQTKALILTFVLACITLFLVYPISAFLQSLGFTLGSNGLHDFVYCVLVIGGPEELVKILPFLLMLRFSKHINEPYDYILYGGVCALGFAFVENILYLTRSGMFSLTGRAFYASVAHIFDTAIICYFMAIAHYKKRSQWLAFLKGFGLAALAHGFYDFWLISDFFKYPLVTIVFFLASIHVLVFMINNTLNISPYFHHERRLRQAKYKFYLTTYLVVLSAAGFVFILFTKSQDAALRFAADTAFWQSYTLVYLVVSLSSLNLVHGYLMPWSSPRNILLPLIRRYPNYLNLTVHLRVAGEQRSKAANLFADGLPANGILSKRVVVNGNFNWYVYTPEHFAQEWKPLGYQLIVCPARFRTHLLSRKAQIFRCAFIKEEEALGNVELRSTQLRAVGNVWLRVK
jgi:RsiW-degrading membrane proteinase PrsW (M82 family)